VSGTNQQSETDMPIERTEIAATVSEYLHRYPLERDRLSRLIGALGAGGDITSRTEFTGHVTCSAIVLNSAGEVLHIRHNALGRWLQPGGHIESRDSSLAQAAYREIEEETGIKPGDLTPLDGNRPLDIDIHAIPANPAKNEADHWHYDIRYAFTLDRDTSITLQVEEVSGYGWHTVERPASPTLAAKLSMLRPRRHES